MKKGASAAVIFTITLVALLLLNRIPAVSNVTHAIQGTLANAGTTFSKAVGRLTKSQNELMIERDYYRDLAAGLSVDQARMAQMERDIQEMQSLLEYTKTSPYQSIAARIVARSGEGEHSVIIDKGEVDGIQPQFAVIVENGHMVGYVEEVRLNTSTVMLLRSENSHVPAMIIGTEETIGIIEGQGGFLLHMDFIPQRIQITESDAVVTSGLDGIFPQGLVIGIVESVAKNETAAFQEAFVEPFYDPDNFTNVLILDPLQERS